MSRLLPALYALVIIIAAALLWRGSRAESHLQRADAEIHSLLDGAEARMIDPDTATREDLALNRGRHHEGELQLERASRLLEEADALRQVPCREGASRSVAWSALTVGGLLMLARVFRIPGSSSDVQAHS